MNTFRFLLIAIATALSIKNIYCLEDAKALIGQIIVNSTQQIAQYSSPIAEGFLDRLTFANPQQGGNGTATSFVPFSISGRTVPNDQCNAIALQPDGCIVMAGTTTAPDGSAHFAVARYLPSGELDPTFGQSGVRAGTQYITFNIAGGTNDQATCVALQQDGKIIVGGYSNSGGGRQRYALARFSPTGQLDNTFGQTGTAQAGSQFIDFLIMGAGTGDFANSIALQEDEKILLGGFSVNVNTKFSLARFLKNGQLDTSFGQIGTARTGTQYINFTITGGIAKDNSAQSIGLQSDGKIILGGTAQNAETYFALARFTSTGQLDTTFGQTGTARAGTQYINFTIAGGTADSGNSMKIQEDNTIILSGSSRNGGGSFLFALARFSAEGQLDTTFGQSGAKAGTNYINFTIAGGNIDAPNSIALQGDSKIILSGYSRTGGGGTPNYFALARFLPNGTLDTATFGNVGGSTAGTTYIPFSISGQTAFDQVKAAALQPDGKIVVGGWSSNNNTAPYYFAVARFAGTVPN